MRTRNRWAGALFSSSSNRVVAVAVAREKCHFYSSCTPTANSPSCKYLLIKGALSVLGGPIDLRVSVWFGVFFYVLFASVSVNTTVYLHPIPPIPPLYIKTHAEFLLFYLFLHTTPHPHCCNPPNSLFLLRMPYVIVVHFAMLYPLLEHPYFLYLYYSLPLLH